jgi:hypothetical protein
MLLLFSAMLLSVPFALFYSGVNIAAGSGVRVILFGLAVYTFFYLAYGPGRLLRAEVFARTVFWTGFFSALFALADFYFQWPPPARFAEQFVWLNSGVYRRAQGVFYESSTLGVLCTFLLTMVAVAALRRQEWLTVHWFWRAIGAIVFLGASVLSFSRASLICLGIALCALLWVERKLWRGVLNVRIAALLVIVGGAAAGGLYAAVPELANAYLQRVWHTARFFVSEPNLILSRRLESWTFLLDYLREHPLASLLGIGYKTLPHTEHLGRPVIADNTYLSLLVETGLSGFTAACFFVAAVLVVSYRAAGNREFALEKSVAVWMFAFWGGMSAQMATGDLFTYWRVLPAFFGALAFMNPGRLP